MTVERSAERIRLLDMLRGFAIFGTLGTNIWLFAHLGDLNRVFTSGTPWWASAGDFLQTLVLFFASGKFLGMLTILFGVGMELKYRQAMRRGAPWPGAYLWVCLFLFLEGFLHFTLVMEYDILMSYAVTATIVAVIMRGGDRRVNRALKGLGGVYAGLMLTLFALEAWLKASGANLSFGDMRDVAALYRNGSWPEQVAYRLSHFALLRIEAVFVIPLNIILFLLGIRLMRAGAFAPDERGRRIRRRMLRIGFGLGVPLNLLLFIPEGGFELSVRYLFAPVLSLGYMALIARLFEGREHLKVWRYIEATGKMALSCYVLQNLLGSVLFYGWGLGWGERLGIPAVIGVWLAVCLFEAVLACWWIGRMKLGPMEWLRKSVLRLVAAR
ncbi:MAG: hypothetical protein A9Z00_11645 [Thermobacillus sp. ZCTH02-B1]|uniref:DUF418 domain-containing protein n=1 Tax=Thermobacillus sp. ZCTH02-B1 TaxID=1858795 RepID=UPI000B579C20|nr:DUF418 domain-containing protein [Thermobacillus sp. ZCTH02-B1]OUM95809.1 MAG: hypothetical protein A9Z00_11645 [Thermobacillus sp. ZCTH02-B1]